MTMLWSGHEPIRVMCDPVTGHINSLWLQGSCPEPDMRLAMLTACQGRLMPNFGGVMGFLRGRVPMPRTSSMGALRTSCVQRWLNSSARHSGSGPPSPSNTFGAASPALAPPSACLCYHRAGALETRPTLHASPPCGARCRL